MFPNKDIFKRDFEDKFIEEKGKPLEDGTYSEYLEVLVWLMDDRIKYQSVKGIGRNKEPENQVYYFSMEFMIGRLMEHYLINLGLRDIVCEGFDEIGINLEKVLEAETEPGLGNGGLGRLAACFLDSMAFLGINGHGNGIRFQYGLFEQKIQEGRQTEVTDKWLADGYPWESRKPTKAVIVKFKGHVNKTYQNGKIQIEHTDYEEVRAVPYDVPIISYDCLPICNTLRLWKAEVVEDNVNFEQFNRGNYAEAISYRAKTEAISSVLYPEDSNYAGRELRLRQQYFYVAAGLTSIIRRYKRKSGFPIGELDKHVAVHINDTHPALCVPELMRLLMDEEELEWEEAWDITVNTISYTNHTILSEALEKWPIDIFSYILPRIYDIVEEINRRMLHRLDSSLNGEGYDRQNVAILWDGNVRMANLAVEGSHSTNGVSALHTEILKKKVFSDFYQIVPQRFNNKTNGVSHRRFLLAANPRLSNLINEAIGEEWIERPFMLDELMRLKDDKEFLKALQTVKYENKVDLAQYLKGKQGIWLSPDSIFDVQVKRIHEYKRQLLNVLRIIDLYENVIENPHLDYQPHTFIFGGKSAAGYNFAKLIIHLICCLAEKINHDKRVSEIINVHFLENFNLSLAQRIYPASQISEQISTAGMEASGTGNMKFMMNGALTFGTLDGANVEISETVGMEHCFIFGLRAEDIAKQRQEGSYRSRTLYESMPRLRRVVDHLIDGFLPEGKDEFMPIYRSLLDDNDHYFVLADFASCVETGSRINSFYKNREDWSRTCLINIANSGVFSSDRAVAQYADDIWKVERRPLVYPTKF